MCVTVYTDLLVNTARFCVISRADLFIKITHEYLRISIAGSLVEKMCDIWKYIYIKQYAERFFLQN